MAALALSEAPADFYRYVEGSPEGSNLMKLANAIEPPSVGSSVAD